MVFTAVCFPLGRGWLVAVRVAGVMVEWFGIPVMTGQAGHASTFVLFLLIYFV